MLPSAALPRSFIPVLVRVLGGPAGEMVTQAANLCVSMAAVCEVCGRHSSVGMSISHSHRRTKRRWYPNIQRVRAIVGGGTRRCTSAPPACANSSMRLRYALPTPKTALRRSVLEKPRSRAAISTLAAKRLTSHSQGPGSVSSKSLTSNTRERSGDANTPKFDRCASPHACTVKPDRGVVARSEAIINAAPRKNANGEVSIRPYRIGTNSGTRDRACDSRSSTGSGRAELSGNTASSAHGTLVRAAFPRAARSTGVR